MSDKIEEYIQKQKSPQKEICTKLREYIFRTLTDTQEEMKWGVPTFADGKLYMVALKHHVNLGFSIEGLAEDKLVLFDGGGKTTKHIEIKSVKDIDKQRINKLLNLTHLVD